MRWIAMLAMIVFIAMSPPKVSAFEDYMDVTLQDAVGATADGTAVDVRKFASVGVSVTISATATVTFEVLTGSGGTWDARACTSTASTSGTLVTTATATGTFSCPTAGATYFRARVSAYTSGTVTVKALATTAISRGGSSGGSLVVTESDASPSITASEIRFTNGTVTDSGGGVASVTISGTGSPTDATYITQTANGTLTNEQALGSLSTGCMSSTTTTGVVATRTLTGTANEITVTNGDCSGTPTFSLPTSIDLGGKTSFEIPNAAAPTTDAFGEIAGDNNAWAASRGAIQFYDGTANTYVLGVLASDTPSNGECPKWNTGGTITWETCTGGSGDVATDTIWNAAGDLAVGSGADTAARLAMGTANQVLKVNAGGTAVEWATDATGGSPTFDGIGSGSNTTATMTVGAGGSIVPTSTGIIAATAIRPTILTVNAGNSPYTGLNTDAILLCDTTAASRAITLPAATVKIVYKVKNLGANTCTITRAGADTIDGATTAVLRSQYEAVDLVSDGSAAWSIF